MFIRPCYRKKDGKRHAYWALVESYRTERGPRQRTVAHLGQCGMPVGYEVFEGNCTDVTTLKRVVQTMESRYGKTNPGATGPS